MHKLINPQAAMMKNERGKNDEKSILMSYSNNNIIIIIWIIFEEEILLVLSIRNYIIGLREFPTDPISAIL